MIVQFKGYRKESTDVSIRQETLSESTLHIAIENQEDEGLMLYMNEEEIEDFILKLQKSLRFRKERRAKKSIERGI